MAIVFALPHLFDRVVARFADEQTVCEQAFGWLAPAEQMRGLRRITWTPGDEGGGLGEVGPPKYQGQNPAQLATLYELCTVEIQAFDPGNRSNERAQYQVTRELYDAWLRAVWLEAHGTFQVRASKWPAGDRTRRAGALIRVVLAVQAPVFDTPIPTAPVDTGASIGLHELDVTESIDVPPPA